MSACMTPGQVEEAFLASPPLIAQTIQDLSVQCPVWARDMFETEQWPIGEGTVMQQLVFRGGRPAIERGLDKWRRLSNNTGCDPCDGPDCSYNWTMFGGHGFDRKITELMTRDFRTPSYCVQEIQTTHSFKEVFAKIVENIYEQTAYFKELSIGLNILSMLAKKYVVDSEGAKPNTNNIYVYPNVGDPTTALAALNIEMLTFFYERMRRIPNCIPYDVVDGAPVYALLASDEILARVYRDDDALRQDVRFSGLANALVEKYNFMSTLRGMFFPVSILYPRRFNIVAGEAVEVLPFIDGVPAEVGEYTDLNPDYMEVATHEEVLIHGRHPFKIFYQDLVESLGANTSFGPDFSFMEAWSWINPLTTSDPFRRVGYFATSAKIGVSQQFSDGIFAVLVPRPSTALMAKYHPVAECPPVDPACTNIIPDTLCPCPLILSITSDPFTADSWVINFATPVVGVVTDPIILMLDSGLSLTGTIDAITADGLTVQASFPAGTMIDACTVVGIFCTNDLSCESVVVEANDCRSNQTGVVDLVLQQAIRALLPADTITAFFGDCSVLPLDIVSVDSTNMTWTVQYAAGAGPTDDPTGAGATVLSADMICDRGGISKVCVPPATDATCPDCELQITPCVDP